MTDKVIITRKICITPDLITQDYATTIFEKLNSTFLNTCVQDVGYIIKIYPNIKILDNVISPTTSNVFFNTQFTAKVLYPKVEESYESKIIGMLSTGILTTIQDKIKVFVPAKNIKNYVYDSEKDTFVHKKTKKMLKNSDTINVVLDAVKYEQQSFKCVGKIN